MAVESAMKSWAEDPDSELFSKSCSELVAELSSELSTELSPELCAEASGEEKRVKETVPAMSARDMKSFKEMMPPATILMNKI